MKIVIELDMGEALRVSGRSVWEVIPDTLQEVGFAAAEAGALEGDITVTNGSRDRVSVGHWEIV